MQTSHTQLQLPWTETGYSDRFTVEAINSTGVDLEDALVRVQLPPNASIRASTVRVVEETDMGEEYSGFRYHQMRSPNSFYYLPVAVQANHLTIKALGKWRSGEARHWAVYWNNPPTYTAPIAYDHLGLNQHVASRIGPNHETSIDGIPTNVTMPSGPIWPWNLIGLFGADTSYQFMFAVYEEGGSRSGFTGATEDKVDSENCFIAVGGTLSDPSGNLEGSYTAKYANHYVTVPYSDNSSEWSLLSVNTVQLKYSMTAKTAFTPSSPNFVAFRLWDIDEHGDTGGQYGSTPFFYQLPGGTFTDAGQGVGHLALSDGMLVGSSNASHVCLMRIDKVAVSGFAGVSSSGVLVNSDSYGFSIGFTDISTSVPVPQGAKIEMDVTLLLHLKGLPVGPDSLTPEEAIRIIQSADPVTGSASALENYTTDTMDADIQSASNQLVAGRHWIVSNAAAKTTLNWNTAYSYDLLQQQVGVSDDDDSSYGEGHVLHGLVLRYLRTKDQGLAPLIEGSVQYFLKLNQLAESRFGSTAKGMIPYWVYPGPGTRTEQLHGKTWTYHVGDPRAWSSLEQIQMSTHGLWAYLYLLRNEDPHLFPSRQAATALLERMEYFESSSAVTQAGWRLDIPDFAQVVGNALHIATGGSHGTLVQNGSTAQYMNVLAPLPWTPHSPWYTQWMVDNQNHLLLGADSNTAIVLFFRAMFAPNTTNDGMLDLVRWMAQDIVITDMGLHQVETDASTTSFGHFIDEYPVGWRPRENTMFGMYDASKAPSHTLLVNNGGARDALFGKNPHYALFLGLCALLDPSYEVPINQTGTTVNIADLFYRTLHVCAGHLVEPSTLVPRRGCSRFLGTGDTVADNIIDNCDLGYFLMAAEVYELVKQRIAGTLDPSTVYRFPGTFTTFHPLIHPAETNPSGQTGGEVMNVRSAGATGSALIGKGTISSGTTTLTLDHALDFRNGQALAIANAGPLCTIPTPSAPTVNLGGGAGGQATYGYRIVALDGQGGCSAASPEVLFNQAPVELTSMTTQGFKASWLTIEFTFQSAAVAYGIYRTTVPQGSSLQTGFVGVFSYNDTPFVDDGIGTKTPPPGIPAAPPTTAVADALTARIVTGAGTKSLLLNTHAITSATGVAVYHDDAPALQAAVDSGHPIVQIPPGTYFCSSPIKVKAKCQVIRGDGKSSILSFLWNQGTLSIEASAVTVQSVHVDANHQNRFCITTENMTSHCSDLVIRDCYCTGSTLTAMDILNQTKDTWTRVSVCDNTCVDTLNGFWLQGSIERAIVERNSLDFTDFNYSGRGICLRNYPTGYVRQASVVGNVIHSGNHTAGITIQGSGLATVTGNVVLTAGGIFGVLCLGDANFDEQTGPAIVSANYFESTWPGTGVAVAIQNYRNVTVDSNAIAHYGFAFEVEPGVGGSVVVDSLANGIRIVNNQLLHLDQGAITQQQKAPLSVKFADNSGYNPVGPLVPDVQTPASGTSYLNHFNVDLTVYQPVFATTSGSEGSVVVKMGPNSTPHALYTQGVSGASTAALPEVVVLQVPQGWYYEFEASGVSFGNTSIVGH